MKQESIELEGRKYELTITDPEIIEEIHSIIMNDKLSDEQCCLMLGLLYYAIDPDYGHAFLLYAFGSDNEILEKMYTDCPITPKNITTALKYMKEHIH